MPFNTLSVATAVTPSVIETYFSHYLNRRPLRQKPTAHISYHEGLKLIRQFLEFSSKHAVEDLQAFTAQWVPAPTWVRTQDCEVPPQFLKRSANVLRKQLGSNGIEKVGGEKWWQWRRLESPLHAEWIEMKKDYNQRKRAGVKCDRVILYVHGGAYYFGSVDEHRYQMQRHARKLNARVLAPRYRLAPQFPFPCGLNDCIATYFYLLEHFEPNQILFAGDSAGGGMVLAMLVVLRDQGCPLPAGTILLSPWVDLTHSFPSTAGDDSLDYIPSHGFHHKPSMAWPPPPRTEAKAKNLERKFTQPVEQPFEVVELPATSEPATVGIKPSRDDLRAAAEEDANKPPPAVLNRMPGLGTKLELTIDDKIVQIVEQFQMYASNELLTHPLVSPVQQPSLGGLPPMLIQVGGGELLRDEQIYLAHKAADPKTYPPSNAVLNEYDPQRTILNQYPPTDVQLQVWEDLCHVPHTLSFTRPAKYMYRSVAQFGAWALARAQHKEIDILDDDAISIISDESQLEKSMDGITRVSTYGSIGDDGVSSTQYKLASIGAVGRAGDDLPPFKEHMIRQRVNRHGLIFPLPHRSEIASLHLDPDSIGALKPGPVRKWLARRAENEQKFANEYKKVFRKREKELQEGYDVAEAGEDPPATALVNRRKKGSAPEEKKKGKSWGLAMWSGWGSSHDESTIQREEKAANEKADDASLAESKRSGSIATTLVGAGSIRDGTVGSTNQLAVPGRDDGAEMTSQRRTSRASILSLKSEEKDGSRPRSPYRPVRDAGQTSAERDIAISPIQEPSVPGVGGSDDGSSFKQRPTSSSRGWGWDLSRRSSGTSGKLNITNRPGSVNTPNQPSSIPGQTAVARSAAPPVPSTSDTGKEVVKIPGTDHTFLNADSSRPHNGTVAYPFKLGKRQQNESTAAASGRESPNPSTMTLDSIEQSDKESLGAGSALKNSVAISELPAVDGNGVAVRKQNSETSPSPEADARSPANSALPEGNISDDNRPVSALDDPTSIAIRRLKSPEEDPVSPINAPTSTIDPSASMAAASYASKQKRLNRFESRDSRIGFLGADGMPTSAFPDPSLPSAPPEKENDMGTDGISKATPFKIRNPVFDSRVAEPQAPAAAAAAAVVAAADVTQQRPEAPVDGSKPAPFKVRNAIYDSKVASPGSKAPGEQASILSNGNDTTVAATAAAVAATTSATDTSSVAANKEVTPLSAAQHAAAVASSSQTQPATPPKEATLTARHAPLPDLPPPPPPKDDPPPPRTIARIPSSGSFKRKPVAASSTAPVTTTTTVPPMIGSLSFESVDTNGSPVVREARPERPGLETFVTASEGLDLGSMGK